MNTNIKTALKATGLLGAAVGGALLLNACAAAPPPSREPLIVIPWEGNCETLRETVAKELTDGGMGDYQRLMQGVSNLAYGIPHVAASYGVDLGLCGIIGTEQGDEI